MPKTPENVRAKQREANISRLLSLLDYYEQSAEQERDKEKARHIIHQIYETRASLKGLGYDFDTGEIMPFRAWTTEQNRRKNGT